MRFPVTVIFLTVIFAYCSQGDDVQEIEYYSSVSGMTKLVSSEPILLGYLQEVISRKYYLKNVIEGYIKDVATMSSNTQENPVDAFKLVYRSYHDMGQLEEQIMRTDHSEAYRKNITELGIHVEERELTGANMALARLQILYQLSTEDLARGILLNYKSLEMRGVDCFEIGRYFHNAGDHSRAVEWLIQARLRLPTDYEDMNELSLISYLASSFFYLDNYKMALKMCHEIVEIDPYNGFALEMIEDSKKNLETLRRFPLTKQLTSSPEVPTPMLVDTYMKVCRGELTPTPHEKRHLRCRYTSNNVPFCILAPFKMEEISLDPYIRVFYDFIYDNEISFLKNKSDSVMRRSQVAAGEGSQISDTRISQHTWLQLEEYEPLANVAARLDDITGLSRDAAEDLQVLNYGIGGHYTPHHDFMGGDRGNYKGYLGNRILTALFYISDVELGGGTGFPLLRLLVPPIKGSLVVWYNQHESLELDYRTLHGGCPVLRGDKHICTLWYHSTYQELRRPCLLYANGNSSIAYKKYY